MKADPFPEARADVEISDLPAHEWVECADCLRGSDIASAADAKAWAEAHIKERPYHLRYRTVRQTPFSVPVPYDVPARR
ncbi:DUF7848 domain-containing protein [Streptomyces scabiei]|uniref:DUF7848 domain-containing protein n=1 Tax=Streptomyces scabiei TaxID=1930 RepID=UPI0029A547B7|nr:hypothetical protein [Streptomyces scabiei]MDX2794064.1 hypothetical protein [Streptomyces scabiei]